MILIDDVISIIGIYTDDTTPCSNCDLAYDLWQQLDKISEFYSELRDTVVHEVAC